MRTNKGNQKEFKDKLKNASSFLHDEIFMPEDLRSLKDLALLLADIEYRNKTNKSLSRSYRQQVGYELSSMREIRLTDNAFKNEDGGY